MPGRSLEERVHDLVADLAADLVPLVRHAALHAAKEALGREIATEVPVPWGRKNHGPRRAVVELVPKPLSPAATLRLAVVKRLAADPDLSEEELVAVLDAEPRLLKLALSMLVSEGGVVAIGAGPGMRYRLAGSRPRAKTRERLEGARLEDAILTQIANRGGLRAEEIIKALAADPAELKRALAQLRADGRLQVSGKARGMRYRVRLDHGSADGPSSNAAEARADAAAAEEEAEPVQR